MTAPADPVLVTGGSGRLGTELLPLLPGALAPDEREMDITGPAAVEAVLSRQKLDVLVHLAAYTDVAGAEKNRHTCWRVNVEGTRNIVQSCLRHGLFLVHVSTDYVFDGTRGGYREEDVLGPVRNYYSLTKLVAEELARLCPRHMVIRTSFRPRVWPYAEAFTDVFTSQDYVDVIAPEIALAIRRWREIPHRTLHIAGERKSVYELARRRKPDVRPASKAAAAVALPDDVSLDTSRWRQLKADWGMQK